MELLEVDSFQDRENHFFLGVFLLARFQCPTPMHLQAALIGFSQEEEAEDKEDKQDGDVLDGIQEFLKKKFVYTHKTIGYEYVF